MLARDLVVAFGTAEMRILLVEDHPESRRVLQRLIERRGHEVTAVGSAEEAEVELAKRPFSFLILDWMLKQQQNSAVFFVRIEARRITTGPFLMH